MNFQPGGRTCPAEKCKCWRGPGSKARTLRRPRASFYLVLLFNCQRQPLGKRNPLVTGRAPGLTLSGHQRNLRNGRRGTKRSCARAMATPRRDLSATIWLGSDERPGFHLVKLLNGSCRPAPAQQARHRPWVDVTTVHHFLWPDIASPRTESLGALWVLDAKG